MQIIIPVILFITTFLLDNFITGVGISLGHSEGNPIVVWLWNVFGYDSIFLRIGYILLVISIGILVYKKLGFKWGLFVLYSFAFGHFLGFCSWVFPEVLNFLTFSVYYMGFLRGTYTIIFFAVVYGFLLAKLQLKLLKN